MRFRRGIEPSGCMQAGLLGAPRPGCRRCRTGRRTGRRTGSPAAPGRSHGRSRPSAAGMSSLNAVPVICGRGWRAAGAIQVARPRTQPRIAVADDADQDRALAPFRHCSTAIDSRPGPAGPAAVAGAWSGRPGATGGSPDWPRRRPASPQADEGDEQADRPPRWPRTAARGWPLTISWRTPARVRIEERPRRR